VTILKRMGLCFRSHHSDCDPISHEGYKLHRGDCPRDSPLGCRNIPIALIYDGKGEAKAHTCDNAYFVNNAPSPWFH
jgi:hypothetical protein